MNRSPSTESSIVGVQHAAIDDISSALREACSALHNKLRELAILGQTEDVEGRIAVLRTRLEALESVERKLLAPIKNEYAFIERSGENHRPWESYALKDRRQFVFLESILKGL